MGIAYHVTYDMKISQWEMLCCCSVKITCKTYSSILHIGLVVPLIMIESCCATDIASDLGEWV